MTSSELARTGEVDSWTSVLGPVGDLAQKLAGTAFVPRAMQGKPATVAAAILMGREMHVGPMAALRSIDVIEGKPVLTSQALAARILAAGHRIEWVQISDTEATVRIIRGDGLSEASATWNINDAKRAGLDRKKNWQQYPRQMLRARALSEAATMACPDVALGLDAADLGTDTATVTAPSGQTVQIHVPTTQPAAEPEAEQPEVVEQPEPEPDVATPRQLRALGAAITDLQQRLDRSLSAQERRELISELVGIPPIDSAKHLTKQQASDAIRAVNDLAASHDDVVDAELVDEPSGDGQQDQDHTDDG